MITALIIDDEQHCIDRLVTLLTDHCATSVQLLGTSGTFDDAIAKARELRPDLLLLDVQLQERTGFELLEQLRDTPCAVVFTTAFERYAVQAFKFSAIDYLLKPVDATDLVAAISKVQHSVERNDVASKLDVLFHNLKHLQGPSKKIAIPTLHGLVFVLVSDIIRCESEVNYTHIFLRDRPKITVAKTLKEFEQLLTEYDFFRVHNSHLINLAYVTRYDRGKGGYVVMTNNSTIEVSTRRKEEFLKRLSGR